MPSGNTLILSDDRVVIDAERGQIDLRQRGVWWNVYQYTGRDEEGTVYAGDFIETVHNDGHSKKGSKP
jgi:hypothetical protein